MNVKYSLNENYLTGHPDDYQALVHPSGSIDREGLVNRILKKGTSLTRTDILAVLNACEETVADAACDGTQTQTTVIIENRPARILVMIPALTPAKYNLKLVTQHSGGKLLKTPKETVFQKILTVA